MKEFDRYKGYKSDFLGASCEVPLPQLSAELEKTVAPVKDAKDNVLRYHNFSLVQHADRRFPIFTATNIDGNLFKQKIPRRKSWRLDTRIDDKHQWGKELYAAKKSDFDRGHMTKREDTQWGRYKKDAKAGSDSTFFYTNAVPQLPRLNQKAWKALENYILKSETITEGRRISVFTGPVLSKQDPVFVTEVDGQQILLPTLFWKIIYFTKSNGQLYRVGFLMGQEDLLEQEKIVHPRMTSRGISLEEDEQLFMDFKEADTCQVNISTIEKLTKLKFPAAQESYKDDRPITLIETEVQTRSLEEAPLSIIEGLVL